MFGSSSQLPTTAERAVIKSNRRVQFRQHSRKLGGAAEHLMDGSPHVIEKRSKYLVVETITLKSVQEHCPGMQNVHLRFPSVGEKRCLLKHSNISS